MGLQTHSNYAKISIHATNAFFFDRRQNFMDPRHPRQNLDRRHQRQFFNPRLNFIGPRRPTPPIPKFDLLYLRTHATHKLKNLI